MTIDRAATLRNAEKLLRTGKLEPAIAEYLRVVQAQPEDWSTANLLGDLYVRAGQSDKAIAQFARIADSLSRDGFFPKAAALYKKIIKIRPDDEHALLQAGEMAATQGVLVDARTYLNTVADLRVARGDREGAAEIRIRLGSLDKALAADLVGTGRQADAIAVLREASEIDPGDEDGRDNCDDPDLLLPIAEVQPRTATLAEGTSAAGPEVLEIDLSDELTDFRPPGAPPAEQAEIADAPRRELDIDEVFQQFRKEAFDGSKHDAARAAYERAVALRDAGLFDESIPAFEAASREPHLRFHAAAALGRLYRQRESLERAIEWLGQASQAPAPTPDEAYSLLLELADALESFGRVDRALATLRELQAETGDYRDVTVRITRLTKVQARG